MAVITGSISNLPNAATLGGDEYLVVDQAVGTPVAATALTVGLAYRVVSLGTTDWAVVGAGAAAAVGTQFTCEAIGTGTGMAQQVETRKATAVAVATASSYVHSQAVPASEWIVNHNLGRYPSVAVYNSGLVQVLAIVSHVSENQTRITVNPPLSGTARFS